jgi:hypothetical protein
MVGEGLALAVVLSIVAEGGRAQFLMWRFF